MSDVASPPAEAAWLAAQERRLFAFPEQWVGADDLAVVFAADGGVAASPAPTYLTARTAHVAALGVLRGREELRPVAARLVAGLRTEGADDWPDRPAHAGADDLPDLPSPGDPTRSLYVLASVLLAGATTSAAGIPGGAELLAEARTRLAAFLDADDRPIDRIGADRTPLPYRGINSAMHLTEALFAIADATGEPAPADQAVDLCRFVIAEARERDGRICEHYDAAWTAQPEHHRDRPHDTFAPYGSTIGHGFEWARLIGQAGIVRADAALQEGAVLLYARARADGLRDGGLIYTVDWTGRPVSARRLHWVAAEALAAAAVLARIPGDPAEAEAEADVAVFGALIRRDFAGAAGDADAGSWVQEVGAPGDAPRPDLYHAVQAMLLPGLPTATSLLAALR